MSQHSGSNMLRIVGGKWRSRRIRFEDAEGLRPTPDRVRETLFNWLQGDIVGAVCLDAFAGSGALGFEALSRGAARVVMVEKARKPFLRLQENVKLLQADQALLIYGSVQEAITKDGAAFSEKFDGVFLDPPFHQSILPAVVGQLLEKEHIKPNGFLYIESEQAWEDLSLPASIVRHKETKAGLVNAFLARYEPAEVNP